MKTRMSRSAMVLVALAGSGIAAAAGPSWAATPFGEANVFLELNDTDGDLGLHALIDGDPWKELELESPDGGEKLKVTANGSLRNHGLTELFFESAEPPFDELSPNAFFRRFPAGMWEISGVTIDGEELESTDLLRHVLAAPPDNVTINGASAAEDCDAVPLPVVSEPVVIDWDPVTAAHPEIGRKGKITVERYELIVEREGAKFSVELPPEVTEFELPEDFTALGDDFKFEIIVREMSGNQTAIESCFEIE
jgi:hypothetical protein